MLAATRAPLVAKKRPFMTRRDWLGYLFISPWIIGFLAFTFLPFLASFFLSFTDWKIVGAWSAPELGAARPISRNFSRGIRIAFRQ